MSAGDGEGFRPLQQSEREILRRLLEDHPFQCREELGKQLDSASARLIEQYNDNYGSIELRVADATAANVRSRVPVEAEYRDDDNCPVCSTPIAEPRGQRCAEEFGCSVSARSGQPF
jgi:hypothetical protein